MDLHLKDRICLVTGASTGNGRATAIALAIDRTRSPGLSRLPHRRTRVTVRLFSLAQPKPRWSIPAALWSMHQRLTMSVDDHRLNPAN